MKLAKNWKIIIVAVLTCGFWLWLLTPTVIMPHFIAECQQKNLQIIIEELEWGMSEVYMYGEPQDYSNFVDETLIDLFSKGHSTQLSRTTNPTFYKVANINVTNVETKWCSPNRIRFDARIEIANVAINKETQEVEVPCWGSATDASYVIAFKDGLWKYSKARVQPLGQIYRVDTRTPVEVLRQSVCP